jgi:hypothetical protein
VPVNNERPLLTGGEQLRREVERAAGGGPKFHPWTVEQAIASIRPQLLALGEATRAIPENLRGERLVLEATIVPNYTAASYFPLRLFEAADLVVLGSRPAVGPYRTERGAERLQPTKRLILGGSTRSLPTLERLASQSHPNRDDARLQEGFRPLGELGLASLEEVVKGRSEGSNLYEAVLHPGWDPVRGRAVPASEETYSKWVAHVTSLGGDVVDRYRRTVADLTFVPVYLNAAVVSQAAAFNPLRVLRPMPKLRPFPVAPLRSMGGLPAPSMPAGTTPESDDRVAIFDGGWDPGCPFTGPFATLHELTPEVQLQDAVQHGSAVTAAAIFGLVDPGAPLPRPRFYVDHYRIWPVPAADLDFDLNWILDRILDTVRASGHRVVNLSLGPYIAVDDNEPHRWTAALDQLAQERDVLFVAAVGNNGRDDPAAGMNRVQVPSDMVNGLAVGACSTAAPGVGWTRSWFSAIGPGRQGARIKPTGLAFGGDGNSHRYVGLGRGGAWFEGNGTSFATPLVTRSVASLLPYADAASGSVINLLRAMAVHFIEPADEGTPIEEVGYGRFDLNLDEALGCSSTSVTVLYQDSIRRGDVAGLAIPLPNGVTGVVSLRWTLALTAPVNPSDMAEYTLAGLEAQFRPHSRVLTFTPPDSSKPVVLNVTQNRARAMELLRLGYRPGENPATRSSGRVKASEAVRRDDGKWETIIQSRDRLRARSLFEPRLDLAYFARSGGVLREVGIPDLEYTLLVTIDEPRGIDLYDRIRVSFPMLVPIETAVQTRIRLS